MSPWFKKLMTEIKQGKYQNGQEGGRQIYRRFSNLNIGLIFPLENKNIFQIKKWVMIRNISVKIE